MTIRLQVNLESLSDVDSTYRTPFKYIFIPDTISYPQPLFVNLLFG
jgi:hypothetical protein